ncbi:MAG: cell division protein FtsA [bacterium]
MSMESELIVGLDIGTTKIAAVVGEVSERGIDIIGLGTHPSHGLRKGVVVNIETTVGAIRAAVEEAEQMAGCEINTVFAGISGGHIQGMNTRSVTAVKEREVRPSDVARVLETARNTCLLPMDREIIHVLPTEFVVDHQDGVREPVGMSGGRLEARVHIVTAATTSAQNIIKCCQRCDLTVAALVLEPLASTLAVLQEAEQELGAVLIDIGGGTTDIVIVEDRSIVYTTVLPLGGNQVTNDLAVGLRTPMNEAERLKQRYGCALIEMVNPDEEVQVPSVGGRKPQVISRQILSEIIEPRAEELFTLVREAVERSGLPEENLASGAVLTGGASAMPGMVELAEVVLGMPVRLGLPRRVGGLAEVVRSPRYSTGVGLVRYGAENFDGVPLLDRESERRGLWTRMKEMFGRAF